ncbi:hypothetical protein BH24ACT12_BH24ACT12_24530 [soil metagenome]
MSTPSIIRTVASRTGMIPKGTPSNCGSRPVLTFVARPDPLGRGSFIGVDDNAPEHPEDTEQRDP